MLKIACRDSGLEDFIKEVSLDYVVGQMVQCFLADRNRR